MEQTKEIKELEMKVDNISKSLSRIENALLGDQFNEMGVLKRLTLLEKDFDTIQTTLDRYKWMAYAACTIIAAQGGFIMYILQIKKLL